MRRGGVFVEGGEGGVWSWGSVCLSLRVVLRVLVGLGCGRGEEVSVPCMRP